MSKTKTTSPHQIKNKTYLSFSYGSSYAIDLENKLITPTDFSSIIDLEKIGMELSLEGEEYSIIAVHPIDFESDIFKRKIEKAYTIQHVSHDVAIYKNSHNRAFCIRIATENDDIVLVEII